MNKLPDVFYEAPKELVGAIVNYVLDNSTFGDVAVRSFINRQENVYGIIKPIEDTVRIDLEDDRCIEVSIHWGNPKMIKLDISDVDMYDSVLWTALKPYLKEEYQVWLDRLLPFMVEYDEEDRVKSL